MKCSLSFLALVFCPVIALAQSTSTPPKPATAPPSSSTPALQPRGPEAVAKQEPNKVVATIDGKQITAQQAVDLINSISPQDRQRNESNLPLLVEQLYTQEQLAADAANAKLDQQAPYKQQLEFMRHQILAQAYLAKLIQDPAATAQAKQYYDAHAADFDQVKVSGIVVAFNPPGTPANNSATARTEADAQAKAMDLEKKIKAGGDFSAIARTDSDQQQTATKGGDMGTFVMADMPPDIKNAIGKLQPNQVAEPVRVNGGYIILKLDTRTRLDFDKVKPGLTRKLILDKYKIHVDDPEFFSAAPQPSNIPSLARPNSPTAPVAPPKLPVK
ncbi:MAG TPA: peptidylprolyl isomerase [Bryobacteraceae bacterium]|nr:peptidylprolyl isomerase [Bryobacteraceae bacterium]